MKRSLLALAACIVLASCMKQQQSELLLNDEAGTKPFAKAMVTRPMKVDFYAIPNRNLPPVECMPSGANVFLGGGMNIYGTATHVGRLNSEQSTGRLLSCNVGPLPYEITTQNEGQIAAANGDLMYFRSLETVNVINGSMKGVVTLTGGTGRFLNSSGYVNIDGTVNFQTGMVYWTGSGEVTY